ncbi:papain-like cysteine protease family protein [Phenylobacterium sp.]|uniref:papain-like cysteine protease family protein n=1 Tax=Phenylobacterium sp. TaxID=1871053 RepID=UPI0035B4A289
MARDLFVASWDKGAPGPWVARHGLTSSDYQHAFDEFTAQGFRLRSISGYESGGQARYAAIWDKRKGGAWAARHGLSSADYQRTFDDLARQGYRPKFINGYAVSGQDRYAGYWEKADGPAWVARHGLTSSAYQQAFDQFVGQGYRPTWISVYAVAGQDRYAAIWEKSGGPAWVARHHQSEQAFRDTCEDLAAQGYDLICAGAAAVGGKDLYAGLWEKNAVASVAHHGMTAPTYQLKFEQLTSQGFQPRFVTGWAGEDPVDVVLRFTMQQQTQANWCWAATGASVARFYDPNTTWTQCLIANGQLGRNDCCGSGASGACNVYGSLSDAFQRTGHLASWNSGTTAFAAIESQILQGRPLGIRVAWSGGGAHFICATGTEDNGLVWVSDCGSGTTSLVAYNTLVNSYNGSGSWTHSYFTKP